MIGMACAVSFPPDASGIISAHNGLSIFCHAVRWPQVPTTLNSRAGISALAEIGVPARAAVHAAAATIRSFRFMSSSLAMR